MSSVNERGVEFEIVEVNADDATGRLVVIAVGRGRRITALGLRQKYSADSDYSRGRLRHLLHVLGVAVDVRGGFNAVDLVGRTFIADVIEDPRPAIGFVWIRERAVHGTPTSPSC